MPVKTLQSTFEIGTSDSNSALITLIEIYISLMIVCTPSLEIYWVFYFKKQDAMKEKSQT